MNQLPGELTPDQCNEAMRQTPQAQRMFAARRGIARAAGLNAVLFARQPAAHPEMVAAVTELEDAVEAFVNR